MDISAETGGKNPRRKAAFALEHSVTPVKAEANFAKCCTNKLTVGGTS
jgi:hypothetical protein